MSENGESSREKDAALSTWARRNPLVALDRVSPVADTVCTNEDALPPAGCPTPSLAPSSMSDIDHKSKALRLYGEGNRPADIVRLIQSEAATTGASAPSRATIFAWLASAKAAAEAIREAEAEVARRDAAARTPALQILRGGEGPEADSDGESYDLRALSRACAKYDGLLIVQGPAALLAILANADTAPRDRIAAVQAAVSVRQVLEAIRGAAVGGSGSGVAGGGMPFVIEFADAEDEAAPVAAPAGAG